MNTRLTSSVLLQQEELMSAKKLKGNKFWFVKQVVLSSKIIGSLKMQ